MIKAREAELSVESIELDLSRMIHTVERELHVHITDDYPLAKFLNQLEMIQWWREEERLRSER